MTKPPFLLKGRVALVTGGGSGIGKAIVTQLAECGASVAFTYKHSQKEAQELVSLIQNQGGWINAYPLDITDFSAIDSLAQTVVQKYERVDILINNAGIVKDALFLNTTDEAWQEVLTTNLLGLVRLTRAVLPEMIYQKHGRVISLSSISATVGGVGQTSYAASKGAIESFTRSLAMEVASKGVTVNAVAPGLVATRMSDRIRHLAGDRLNSLIPLGRLGAPEEVASLISFLAADEASYITGQTFIVDGGLSLQDRRPL